jgi:hypothetical protein
MKTLKDVHKSLDDHFFQSILILSDSYPQIIKSSLEDVFNYAGLLEDNLSLLILKNNHCLIFDEDNQESIKKSNILATSIYRDYTNTYYINEVIYGNAIILGYNSILTQNNERFHSISTLYMNEIINRFNVL